MLLRLVWTMMSKLKGYYYCQKNKEEKHRKTLKPNGLEENAEVCIVILGCLTIVMSI
jgi:hypothetical protein